ncbi:MAG: DUF2339 domain-containing protein [Lachnospiraceae bacterium]|nr:DUF2339 domain-containing protein [Lachnospiraceae bacterium]
MEDRELRERLSRIEKHLGMEPYETDVAKKESEISQNAPEGPAVVQTVKIDRIGELLLFIEEKRSEVKEEAFLGYLRKMEEALCREQVKIDDLAANLYHNYDIYIKRNEKVLHPEVAVPQPEVEIKQSVENEASEMMVAAPQPEVKKEEENLFVPEPEFMRPVSPKEEPAAAVKQSPRQEVYNRPAKKTDMEFGIGAVVLSIVGALFIIAALIIFGLNFMDNLQQGIFFYVLAGVVIAFSELVLRKHLERFAQAVTGIGVCVLYTATILNYLYLHTMNSVAALLATVAVSVFALLLSRKRESASLRMIGILGCYISLMPLDKFQSQTEFIIPCVILLIVNVIYLILPVSRNDRAVRNVHSMANFVASAYLMGMAWASDLSAAWIFVYLAAILLIHYIIYYGTEPVGSLKGFYIAGQILLHALLTFVVWDEKFYIVATLIIALVNGAGIFLYRDKSIRWVGLHCFAGYFVLVCSSMSMGECLVGMSVLYVVYQVLTRIWNEDLRVANFIVSIYAASLFLTNMQSDSNMQYVLLAVLVLSIVAIKNDKAFHEILLMSVLWVFGLSGFDALAIALPLSVIFLLACVVLFTRVEMYRSSKVNVLVVFAWVYNGMSLLSSVIEMADPNRISMTILLLAESALLMMLFSEASGTKPENIVKCRTHALTLFFTYMVLAYNIGLPIAVSILLMMIAVASVAVGFWLKIKSVRIYGLCMSLFVCGKLLLVDFADAQSADRVISFLVVGVIALAISYLYMRIERSLAEKENL